MTTKECTVCKHHKPLTDYYACKRAADGKGYRCKGCDNDARRKSRNASIGTTKAGYRRRALQWKYGLTLEDYASMLAKQGGRCAICETTNPLGEGNTTAKRSFSFAVDHCHATGSIRGLLCNPCNRGIGFLRDDATLVAKALTYLKENV